MDLGLKGRVAFVAGGSKGLTILVDGGKTVAY